MAVSLGPSYHFKTEGVRPISREFNLGERNPWEACGILIVDGRYARGRTDPECHFRVGPKWR